MSLFAGIYSRHGAPLDATAISSLISALRRSGDEPETFQDDRFFVAKVNVGALDTLGLHRGAAGDTVALAGSPFFRDASTSRASDLAALSNQLVEQWGDGKLQALRECRGQFSLAHYHPSRNQVLLATDFCGVRPLYYCLEEGQLIFATALHVLETRGLISKRMDLQGVGEKLCFGFPLADRTPYENIKLLRSGQALLCRDGDGEVRLQSYYGMDEVRESRANYEEQVEEAHSLFLAAIRRRGRHAVDALAFLSGGLDSRCIVAGLTSVGKRVRCINFVRPGRLDTSLARRFARKVDLPLFELEVPDGEPQPVSKGHAASRTALPESEPASFPNVVFSGDGGSVGAGYLYLTPELVELARSGGLAAASRGFVERFGRPSRLAFRASEHRRLFAELMRATQAELERLDDGVEPGRQCHLFLMQNSQHRILHHHFENIDKYRAEFMLPFFDADFMRCLLAIPVDKGLRHGFYHDWMERFEPALREVPWQAYPGHLPCPVPLDPEDELALTQWQSSRAIEWARARESFDKCRAGFMSLSLPDIGIRPGRVLMALLLHSLRIRNGVGLFRAVNEYTEYYGMSAGEAGDPVR